MTDTNSELALVASDIESEEFRGAEKALNALQAKLATPNLHASIRRVELALDLLRRGMDPYLFDFWRETYAANDPRWWDPAWVNQFMAQATPTSGEG